MKRALKVSSNNSNSRPEKVFTCLTNLRKKMGILTLDLFSQIQHEHIFHRPHLKQIKKAKWSILWDFLCNALNQWIHDNNLTWFLELPSDSFFLLSESKAKTQIFSKIHKYWSELVFYLFEEVHGCLSLMCFLRERRLEQLKQINTALDLC